MITIASGNPKKVAEIKAMLGPLPIEVKKQPSSLDVEETGKTYLENAILKAKAAAAIVKLLVIAAAALAFNIALSKYVLPVSSTSRELGCFFTSTGRGPSIALISATLFGFPLAIVIDEFLKSKTKSEVHGLT